MIACTLFFLYDLFSSLCFSIVGMATIEDSDKIKQEVRLLENLVRELETKSLTMESALATKQHSLGALQKHCDDAKRWV